jgi:hypothetical protein
MTRRTVLGAIVAILAAGWLAACGGSDEQQTEAGPDTPATTASSADNGATTDEVIETNGGDETTDTSETTETNGEDGMTTTDDQEGDGGCPADGSGNCTFIIRCPEADYEYRIPGAAAASATIVGAKPSAVADPDTPARSIDDVVDVTVEVEAERVRLTTLCADGVTPAEATQPLEATGG